MPRLDFYTAWSRMYRMSQPLTAAEQKTMSIMKFSAVASWPLMGGFMYYTVQKDHEEHHAKAAKYNAVNYPHLNKVNGITYTWGTPCSALDFQCDRALKIKNDVAKAKEQAEAAANEAARLERIAEAIANKQ